MGLSCACKLLIVLVVTAYVFSGTAEAWSWSLASVNSRSGSSGSRSDPHSGSNHSSGNGSTHKSHKSGSNHSTSHGHHNHTAPSKHSSHQTAPLNHSSGTGSTSNSHHHKHTAPLSPRRNIVVTVWKKGFKYQEWVAKNSPFYINDVLVFKYNSNNKENNVYLLQDLRSYVRCDVKKGKKLVARGGSSGGFKLLLQRTQTYYFARLQPHQDAVRPQPMVKTIITPNSLNFLNLYFSFKL
ncbi:unnamed protein product [Arabis nemorensis]|uniref:Phytocyanin domain-containing protein n=1 Tax=Arabis nemorensis TaxID=586526 RepID=A0A565CL43_9BRAS|nr:unnamed protein product [Arabis nemorensis]